MSRSSESRRRRGKTVRRHSLFTRLWHWLTVLCLLVLLMSGLQIFNAHPALYWGSQSDFDNPALSIGAYRDADGHARGRLVIGDTVLDTTGVLGISRREGSLERRAFPAWATLPGPQWLAMGRYWHFAAAWLFAPLLICYLGYSLASRPRRRRLLPSRGEWRGLPASLVAHLKLRFHRTHDYNPLQKLAYVAVLFGLLPLMVLTGLTMSPTLNAAWPWLLDLFGGRQSARTLHFIGTWLLVAFFITHIALVLVSGLFNNLRSMITGGYRIPEPAKDDHER